MFTSRRRRSATMPVTGWRWEKIPIRENPGLPETAEKFDDSTLGQAPVESESGPFAGAGKRRFPRHGHADGPGPCAAAPPSN